MNISFAETNSTLKAEIDLLMAERYVNFELDDRARQSLNSATVGLRALSRLYKRRRGAPRKTLQLKIYYLEIWHRALVGVLKKRQGHAVGMALINKALIDATDLVQNYEDSAKSQELLRKVSEWQQQ